MLARLADNYRWRDETWQPPSGEYRGPWQFFGRDIDPTLPPALPSDDEDDLAEPPRTFDEDRADDWWVSQGPRYAGGHQAYIDAWVRDPSDVPQTEDLVTKVDPEGNRWVVVRAYSTWKESVPEDEDPYGRERIEQWTHLYPWLVRREDARQLLAFLRRKSLMGRWMPEGGDFIAGPYLGEVPWAASCQEYPAEWTRGYDDLPVDVLPFATGYTWEGGGLDCSITESVHAAVPVLEVFQAGSLLWAGGRSWTSGGEAVVEYREASDAFSSHSVLLVRESWLRGVLESLGCTLVIGRLGEKQVLGPSFAPRNGRPWLEINGRATYDGGRWRFDRLQVEAKEPA